MSLYPKIFGRHISNSVPNFMLVSLKAHFFHISAGLIIHIKYNILAKLKSSQKCKNEALAKFDARENILLYSIAWTVRGT